MHKEYSRSNASNRGHSSDESALEVESTYQDDTILDGTERIDKIKKTKSVNKVISVYLLIKPIYKRKLIAT